MIRQLLVLLSLVCVAAAAGADPCRSCRSVVSYARQFNSTTHRQEYKDLFKGFCEHYYPTSTDYQQGPCPTFIEGLFYVLENTDPIHHCDEIGACGKPDLPSDDIYDYLRISSEAEATVGRDEIICLFCTQLMDQIKASLSNPETIATLKEQADAFCEYLAVIKQDKECRQVIDNYLDQIVAFIRNINSKGYCRSISICPKTAKNIMHKSTVRRLPTLADFNNFGIETSVSIDSKLATDASKTHKLAGFQCMLCKNMVKEMFSFLRENKTEANIITGLNQVCHWIYPSGGASYDECQGMVKAYTRELVQLLVDETDPDMICTLIELCTHAPQPSKKASTNSIENAVRARESTNQHVCRGCIDITTKLDEYLSNNSVGQDITSLMAACESFDDRLIKRQCVNMINNNGIDLVSLVPTMESPRQVCRDISLC